MYPPSWACEAVYRIHPQLRIGWAGRPRGDGGELNQGDFALVQLYHKSDVGPMGDPITSRETWDVTTIEGPFGETERVRCARGPIYSKTGSSRRDWDPLVRVPMFICTLNDAYGIDQKNDDGIWSQTIEKIHRWVRPVYDRIREHEVEKGRRMNYEAEELGREMTDSLWRDANNNDTGRVMMTKDDAMKNTNWGRLERNKNLDFASNSQLPLAPKGARYSK